MEFIKAGSCWDWPYERDWKEYYLNEDEPDLLTREQVDKRRLKWILLPTIEKLTRVNNR